MQWTLGAFGGGAGLVLGIAAIKALMSRPEFVPQLVSGGFLGFAALTIGMLIFNRQFQSFIAMQERTALAQEQLATNVGALVSKINLRDEAMEQRLREQELTLNHLARQADKNAAELGVLRTSSEEILGHLGQMRKERDGE
jgi:N-acyl-D-aspartate/D-glutamate deacylase